MDVLKNQHLQFLKKIEDQIKYHNQRMEFEHSKLLQEYIENFDTIFETIRTKYSAAKFATDIIAATTTRNYVADINETAQLGLQKMLKLPAPIRIIDCFDISHFQSHYIVGSCVRFVDGKPDKNKFRRFQIRTLDQQDDYSALREIVSRRYKDTQDLPDLILIDGGKGQLNAVQDLFPQAHFASLAKREERLYSNNNPDGLLLDIKTDAGKLLIALRDYAHHFAISYHRLRRSKGLANI
jgi:excinuclease ABC subunit C